MVSGKKTILYENFLFFDSNHFAKNIVTHIPDVSLFAIDG